jgi:hypothetical protein
MIVAHIMGIPIEESASQLVPAGAAMATAVAVGARVWLDRVKRRRGARGTRGPAR